MTPAHCDPATYRRPVFGHRPLSHTFAVTPDALWHALTAALPLVTQQATWYERAHRVEWVVDATGSSWTQLQNATVEPTPQGAVLTFSGKSPYRSAIGDSGRRERAFETLVAAITEAFAHPLTMHVEDHDSDEFRYWNGQEWTVEPPPPPSWPPPP